MADIKVKIGTNLSPLQRGFNKAKSWGHGLARSFKKIFGGIGGKIAGWVGIGATIAAIKSTANALDELQKQADNLNFNVEEWQRWTLAAGLAGNKARDFQNGVGNMLKMLSMALDGQAGAIDKFRRLGLDPEQLRGREVSDQLGMVFDAINSVDDKTRKVGLSMELFGRSGKRIGVLASQWRELKDQIGDKIIKEEHLRDAEKFNDAMLQLEKTLHKIVIESGLIQALTGVSKVIDDIYSKKPRKDNYKVKKNQKKIDYMDVAENAIKQQRKKDGTFYEDRQVYNPDMGMNDTGGMPTGTMSPYQTIRIERPVSDQEKESWLNENFPDWRKKGNTLDAGRIKRARQDIQIKFPNLSQHEKELITLANTLEDLNKLEKQFEAIARKRERLNGAKSGVEKRLGNLSDKERSSLDSAKTVQDVYKAEKLITEQRKERKKLDAQDQTIKDKIKSMETEFRYQQLLLSGDKKRAEVYKALKEAKEKAGRELTEQEAADITKWTLKNIDIQNAINDKNNLNPLQNFNPQPLQFKGDSIRAMGGIIGPQAQFTDTSRQILKNQATSLKNLEQITRQIELHMPDRSKSTSGVFTQ